MSSFDVALMTVRLLDRPGAHEVGTPHRQICCLEPTPLARPSLPSRSRRASCSAPRTLGTACLLNDDEDLRVTAVELPRTHISRSRVRSSWPTLATCLIHGRLRVLARSSSTRALEPSRRAAERRAGAARSPPIATLGSRSRYRGPPGRDGLVSTASSRPHRLAPSDPALDGERRVVRLRVSRRSRGPLGSPTASPRCLSRRSAPGEASSTRSRLPATDAGLTLRPSPGSAAPGCRRRVTQAAYVHDAPGPT